MSDALVKLLDLETAWARVLADIRDRRVFIRHPFEIELVEINRASWLEGLGETLRTDRLVWVGVPGGDAHLRDPLPVSLGAPTCVFRPVAIEALGKARRDWRAVCEVSRMEPVYAAIEAGLAVAPLLRSSVPDRFEVLGRAARLPALPEFRINLYAPPGLSPAARDLADHVRGHFAGQAPMA